MVEWVKQAVVVDFETFPIEDRPDYPPMPVGVAIREPGQKSRYYSFGHPSGNTSTWEQAKAALAKVWAGRRPVLGHNLAKFDQLVAERWFELPPLAVDRVKDTLPGLFLLDPRAPDYALKSTAERMLGIKPDERDAVNDWLIATQPIPGKKLGKAKGDNYAGAYVAFCPADIAGPYACGDTDRTLDVGLEVFAEVERRGMLVPYEREMQLVPLLLEMESQGLRLDLERLEQDVASYESFAAKLEIWIRQRLGATEELNLDSGAQLAEALLKAGLATEEGLGRTATGKLQTNKAALDAGVTDPQVLGALRYRAALGTSLETFMRPWLQTALRSGGYIFATWHSTRNDHGDSTAGARTGRFSSTPNFMNLPNPFNPHFKQHASREDLTAAKKSGKVYPDSPVPKLPNLPLVRSYVVPYEEGHVLLGRDYAQQEPRILAHYEDGPLRDAYLRDPWVDYHDNAKAELLKAGIDLPRKHVKVINLALIYGMGIGKMAAKTGLSVEETKRVREAILQAYPGLKQLYADMKLRAKQDLPIRTWGGREYFVEPPKWVDGQLRLFDYKLPNILIQGSAADCTKVAMLRYAAAKPAHHRLLLTVHDELTVSVPRDERDEGMKILKECMESVEFDVPMLSEGEWSAENWAAMLPYDEKGRLVVDQAA